MNFHGGSGSKDLIDFSVNVNRTKKSEHIRKIYEETFDHLHEYPSIDQADLIEALSDHYGIDKTRLIVGNGVTELMFLLARNLKLKTIGIFEPTYSEYRRAFELAGTKVVSLQYPKIIPLDGYILCNPNNPTGTYEREIDALLATGKPVILDESFLDFVEDPVSFSSPNLIKLHSLTKYFGIAGLRIGFIEGEPSLIESLFKEKEPWTVNSVAEALLEPLLKDTSFHEKTKEWLREERAYLKRELPMIKGGEANFFLLESEKELFEPLKEKGIYVRPCKDFSGLAKHSIRFCIHSHENNVLLVKALKEIL
ncbi:threonine-phosphate decarboxylase [Guggenheimella bovis]